LSLRHSRAGGAATLVLGFAFALLAACAPLVRRGTPSPAPALPPPAQPPSAPRSAPPNVGSVPDATPRYEPRSALGNPPFYEVAGRRYVVLSSAAGYRERGVASWYGAQFDGLRTATGDPYDMFAMTAAHRTLPLPCYARVTNLSNGRSVIVRVNDRGPFINNRIIDLSYTAAAKLDMLREGTAFVEVEAVMPLSSAPAAPLVASQEASGAPPTLLSVASQAASAPSAPPATPASQYYIQVGAYGVTSNAEQSVARLRSAGLQHVLLLPASREQPLQRVRIGPIASVQEFDQLIARLSQLGFTGARLAQD
jgi:rare lipoprotein A